MDRVGLQLARQVALAGFIEPVREDLVNGSALGPVRGLKVRRNTAQLPQVAVFHVGVVPLLEQPEASVGGINIEVIKVQAGVGNGKIAAEDLVGSPAALLAQLNVLGICAVVVVQNAEDPGRPDRSGNMNVKGAGLPRHQGAEGGLVHGLLAVV